MPYKLKKKYKEDLYFVVNEETGKKYSNEALTHEKALSQMRALYSKEGIPFRKVAKKGTQPKKARKWESEEAKNKFMEYIRSKNPIFKNRSETPEPSS
jgi:hypothetical protein